MRKSRVKEKLRSKKPVHILQQHLMDPSTFELSSLMGFDAIWIDLEHHSHSMSTASDMIRATRIGSSDVITRAAKGEFMNLGRILEMGSTGLMYPRCSNADEARELVRWSKFAPMGERGMDGSGPDNPYRTIGTAEYAKLANEETFLIVQLEEQSAIDKADEIAAVEGVDVIMLGPSDYSVLMGIPGQMDHELIHEAERKVAAAAEKHGKNWGRPSRHHEETKRLLELGARMIFHGTDIMILKNQFQKLQDEMKELGFTYENQLV